MGDGQDYYEPDQHDFGPMIYPIGGSMIENSRTSPCAPETFIKSLGIPFVNL